MGHYIFRRILMLVPTLVGITLVSFLILQLVPGDPARTIVGVEAEEEVVQELRVRLGLDKPVIVQYANFLKNAMQGDLGVSIRTQNAVLKEISPRFFNTVKLAITSMFISIPLGIILGAIASIKQNTKIDYLIMGGVLLGISTPSFWLGMIMVLIFSVKIGWFPSGGAEGLTSLILPSLTLAAPSIAVIARMTRSSMLETLRQDYIGTARAKGLNESKVIYKHALKNALIPTITIVGLQFGYLLGGAVLVETVFTWPGLGRLIVDSIYSRDYPLVQGGVMFFSFSFVIVNLIVDIIYTYLDPRISYE